jgi:hypothetical protein
MPFKGLPHTTLIRKEKKRREEKRREEKRREEKRRTIVLLGNHQ